MGGVPPALLARRALAVPGGGLPSLSPVAPAFRLLFCPYPPAPLPGGKGGTKVILCKGLRPLHPRAEPGLNGNRKGAPVPSGGFPSLSPAAPAFRFDSAPYPPARARRAIFPGGEGGDQGYFMQRASPLASPGIDRRGTGYACRKPVLRALPGEHLLCRCQLRLRSIHNREKFLGVWGLLSRSPQRLSRFSRPSPSLPAVHRRTQGETANCTKMRKTVDIERVYWYNGGGKGRVPCSAPAERDAGRVRKG